MKLDSSDPRHSPGISEVLALLRASTCSPEATEHLGLDFQKVAKIVDHEVTCMESLGLVLAL